jgi:5-methylcytosine-specific restriction endonuclease McrA
MGSRSGVITVAAKRLGLDVERYIALRDQGLKHCRKCRQWRRAAKDFGVDNTRGDGRSAVCVSCKSQRKYASTKFLSLSPEDANRQAYRRWYANGGAAYVRARVYARKRGIEPLPPEAAEMLLEVTNGACIYCGEPATTFDHIVAVRHGGRTIPGNMAPACRSCNSSKGTKDVFAWLESRGIPVPLKLVDIILISEVGLG